MPESTVHMLVAENDAETLAAFLRSIGDARMAVNELDEDGLSPLFRAVGRELPNAQLVEVLLKAGADPNFVCVERWPVLPVELQNEASEALQGMAFDQSIVSQFASMPEIRESVLQVAIRGGDVQLVRSLLEHGADLTYTDQHGYTAMLDAVHGPGDRLPLVRFLLSLGIDVNRKSVYGESPVGSAYRLRKYDVVRELIAAGVDASRIAWPPLIRAIAIGSAEDVERELGRNPRLNARDSLGQTALQLALSLGDVALCDCLVARGADPRGGRRRWNTSMAQAVESGSAAAVQWLVRQGAPADTRTAMGHTALADASERGHVGIVLALLSFGADPNAERKYGSILEYATGKEVIGALLESGANPANLTHAGIRALLDLDDSPTDLLARVTEQQYRAGRSPREGRFNPENLTDAFKLTMIRAGCNAYQPRKRFGDVHYSCPIPGSRGDPVWCADRFGQSFTRLPDERALLIAGEHEDSYDPDFCIYNDVFVFEPDGEIRIYGYPYAVFPPTDFHTATLVGRDIYIIGSLGYGDRRANRAEVYKLSTQDFHIEPVACEGDSPPWIYKHRAWFVPPYSIQIQGGTAVKRVDDGEDHLANRVVYQLNLSSRVWLRVRARPVDPTCR